MKSQELNRLWPIYQAAVKKGDIPNFRSLGLLVGSPQHHDLAGSQLDPGSQQRLKDITNALIGVWSSKTTAMEGADMDDEKKLLDLGLKFLKRAEWGPLEDFEQILNEGFPVNFQHPRHLYTALHMAVSENAPVNHKMVELLLNTDQEIDLLIEDEVGRIPWNTALFFGFDETLTEAVYRRTKEQAEAENIDIHAEFKRKFRETWMHSNWFASVSRKRNLTFDFDLS